MTAPLEPATAASRPSPTTSPRGPAGAETPSGSSTTGSGTSLPEAPACQRNHARYPSEHAAETVLKAAPMTNGDAPQVELVLSRPRAAAAGLQPDRGCRPWSNGASSAGASSVSRLAPSPASPATGHPRLDRNGVVVGLVWRSSVSRRRSTVSGPGAECQLGDEGSRAADAARQLGILAWADRAETERTPAHCRRPTQPLGLQFNLVPHGAVPEVRSRHAAFAQDRAFDVGGVPDGSVRFRSRPTSLFSITDGRGACSSLLSTLTMLGVTEEGLGGRLSVCPERGMSPATGSGGPPPSSRSRSRRARARRARRGPAGVEPRPAAMCGRACLSERDARVVRHGWRRRSRPYCCASSADRGTSISTRWRHRSSRPARASRCPPAPPDGHTRRPHSWVSRDDRRLPLCDRSPSSARGEHKPSEHFYTVEFDGSDILGRRRRARHAVR